jgi:glycosyltransferase involved in cell wall biosynthesis
MNWLIISTVDPLVRPNNREHGLLRHLAARFQRVDHVFRRDVGKGSRLDALRCALVPSTHVSQKGNISFVAVNPVLNHRHGMVRDVSGVSKAAGRGASARFASTCAYAVLGPIGIIKDISTIFFLTRAAKRRIEPGRQTVCSVFGPWAAAAAWWLRRTGRIASFIYEDRDYEPGFVESGPRRAWARWLENRMIIAADEVTTVGERLVNLRLSETGREVMLVPTGAEPAAARTGETDRKPVLVYIGNVANWSALEVIVAALPEISRRVHGVSLRIVGAGPDEALSRIAAAAKALNVEGRVEFCGAVPHGEVGALIADASVGIATFVPNALRTYATPLKVVEYMAAGLPTLATADTEAADIIARHECGEAVALDPAQIARAVTGLLTDRARWQKLSNNALKAAPHYSWSRIAEIEWDVILRVALEREPQSRSCLRPDAAGQEGSSHAR